MTEQDVSQVAQAWLVAAEAGRGTEEFESNWWATEKVLTLHRHAERLWEFICLVYPQLQSASAKSVFAAGPLEDILNYHGAQYIDAIEKLAAEDDRFNYLLGGVWKSQIHPDVWSRIKSVRKSVW